MYVDRPIILHIKSNLAVHYLFYNDCETYRKQYYKIEPYNSFEKSINNKTFYIEELYNKYVEVT